uniref:Metalloendopeptidase n=1 Tax=Strongyloides venezuelensis TaxID=75913 RepID=A0A0K0FES3_STRVS
MNYFLQVNLCILQRIDFQSFFDMKVPVSGRDLNKLSTFLIVIRFLLWICCSSIIYVELPKKAGNLWTIPIEYKIGRELNNGIIKEALKEIENNTCIRFKEDNSLSNNNKGIIFEKSKVCSSYVGLVNVNKRQTVNLTYECSSEKGYVLHEVGHALGLLHEHCRTDRDEFITINFNNIKTGLNGNFEIPRSVNYNNYSTHYDYGSIMHYSSYEFSTSYWRKVLTSKIHTEYDRMMGQRSYMTFNDYKKINLLYCSECKKTKETEEEKVECLNGGYIDYKNCSRCLCPFGYTGDSCSEIMKSDERCNTTTFNANNTIFYHWIAGPYKCFFHIKTDERKKIEFGIYQSSTPYKDICTQDISHQVKYLEDKGSTGLLLCAWRNNIINITSESNNVLIFFNGDKNYAHIQFGFRAVS